MGFTSDKIPYGLDFGLDLSNYNESQEFFHSNLFYEIVRKLEEFKLDFIISNVSVKDQKIRCQAFNYDGIDYPIFLNDSFLFSYEWKNKFRGKLHDIDLTSIEENHKLIKMDSDFCNHISSKCIITDLFTNMVEKSLDNFLFYKLMKKYLSDNIDKQIHLSVDFNREGLKHLKIIQSGLGYHENLGVILKLAPNLPEQEVLKEFLSFNIRSVSLPFSIFVTNKSGYPVLSKFHQEYLKILFTHRIEIIFFDDCNLLIDLKKESIENFSKLKDYYLYICHIFNSHNEFSPKDYILLNYYDFFQTPLQPLRDNLQSQTYECFEEDSIKYELYQNAIEKALTNFKTKGRLSINNLSNKMIIEDDYCKSLNNNRILHAYVLGAGRGPLARRLINAALNLGFVIGKDIKITCVEKNRNAFNTLQYLQLCESELFSKVQMVFSDMRDFKPEEKADIVISELLGSFGDNELSPECLIKIQNYLSEDSVMIPNSYTSFIRPVACPVVWSAIRKLDNNYQSPYVILLKRAYYPIEKVEECFTFKHPVIERDLNQMKSINFKFEKEAVIYGFAGYFRAILYDDVEISILPDNPTPGMISWFPIYFASIYPIELKPDDILTINISRENDSKKVWYEWNFGIALNGDLSNEERNKKESSHEVIHNLGGSHSSILL